MLPSLPHSVVALWPPTPAALGALFLLAVALGAVAPVAVRVAEGLVVIAARRRGDVPAHEPVDTRSGAARRRSLAVAAGLLAVTAGTVVAATGALRAVGV